MLRTPAKAESSARRALELDSSEKWIFTNLASALVFQGKFEEKAIEIYKNFKGQAYNEERSWTRVFLEDIDTLEAAGVTHPDFEKVKAFLKE